MTTYLLVLVCVAVGVAVGALAVLAFAAIRVSREVVSADRALDALVKYARVVMSQPRPPAKEPAYLGALLEFADDGLPRRMSVSPKSPYYFPTQATVTLDGEPVERCLEVDRYHGWVQSENDMGQALPRRFGRVEVSVG